jgi:hypothetical protein
VLADKNYVLKRDEQFLEFKLKDSHDEVMPVVYRGVIPGNFDQATSVVAIGRYKSDHFEAEQLLVKCPSKYQARGREGKDRFVNLGQLFAWVAFLAALVAGAVFPGGDRRARVGAEAGARSRSRAVARARSPPPLLWRCSSRTSSATSTSRYYSSRSMPGTTSSPAFWGGQEGRSCCGRSSPARSGWC